MRYRLKNILIAVTVATLVTVPSVYADNAYRRAAPRGWLWYEETPAQPKPVPRRPPAPQPAAPVRAAQPESTGPELFSAAWVRQQLPILLDRAMTNPTEENVRAYKYGASGIGYVHQLRQYERTGGAHRSDVGRVGKVSDFINGQSAGLVADQPCP